jgi:hypothetical protein
MGGKGEKDFSLVYESKAIGAHGAGKMTRETHHHTQRKNAKKAPFPHHDICFPFVRLKCFCFYVHLSSSNFQVTAKLQFHFRWLITSATLRWVINQKQYRDGAPFSRRLR